MTTLEAPKVEMCDAPGPLSRSGRRTAEKFRDVLWKIDELLVVTDAAAACTDEQLAAVFTEDARTDLIALRYNVAVAQEYIDNIMPYLGKRPAAPPASTAVVPTGTFYWAEPDATNTTPPGDRKRPHCTNRTPEAQQTAMKVHRVIETVRELLALVEKANESTDAQLAAAFCDDLSVHLARHDLGGLLFNLDTAGGRLDAIMPHFEVEV